MSAYLCQPVDFELNFIQFTRSEVKVSATQWTVLSDDRYVV
jgi:hypothetical protein